MFSSPMFRTPTLHTFVVAAFLATSGACLATAPSIASADAGTARSESWQDQPALLKRFEERGMRGTFVVLDSQDRRWIAADSKRAFQRFRPASTFKIPNTLIALETGVARDDKQAFKWDGQKRWVEDWNRDLDLTEAFRVSAVWAYQEIARGVGSTRMQQALRDFRYGNAAITPKVDNFWLDGDLRISPVEQVEFLRRLDEGRLPLSARTLEIGRRVMLREEKNGYRLYAKTGWDNNKPAIGWYVGWVERGERRTWFALNVDMTSVDVAPKRELLVRQLLKELGYLPD
ncbi:class D beta-lactamase [Uliginosibacterium sp. H1]|uniref:class D beta-lactamase n=1 Tax=Uliginosibacterium sp. H1 TaxID=3114757 RepID=UPI002E16CB15|nr:class D beta-lactamase [Uliginosibacterium sp. H1]